MQITYLRLLILHLKTGGLQSYSKIPQPPIINLQCIGFCFIGSFFLSRKAETNVL